MTYTRPNQIHLKMPFDSETSERTMNKKWPSKGSVAEEITNEIKKTNV